MMMSRLPRSPACLRFNSSSFNSRRQRENHSQAASATIWGEGGIEDQALRNQGVVGVGAGRGRLRELQGGQNPPCDAPGLLFGTSERSDSAHRGSESSHAHVHIATTSEYEAILVTPQEAWNIICRMQAFERLLTLLVAVTGLRIGEMLALRWEHVDWSKFRIHVVSNFVRGKFGEPKSAASKKPVVLHPLVMGLLKYWRETAYAGDEDFIFASARLKGKAPRVPNMLVEDHLRPAAKLVIEIPDGHRFGFHNLRHALTLFLVEIGTDSKTIQDMLRWADPSILLKVYAHSRMDKRMEAQAKMIDAMGLNKQTVRRIM
jgi:integrase